MTCLPAIKKSSSAIAVIATEGNGKLTMRSRVMRLGALQHSLRAWKDMLTPGPHTLQALIDFHSMR